MPGQQYRPLELAPPTPVEHAPEVAEYVEFPMHAVQHAPETPLLGELAQQAEDHVYDIFEPESAEDGGYLYDTVEDLNVDGIEPPPNQPEYVILDEFLRANGLEAPVHEEAAEDGGYDIFEPESAEDGDYLQLDLNPDQVVPAPPQVEAAEHGDYMDLDADLDEHGRIAPVLAEQAEELQPLGPLTKYTNLASLGAEYHGESEEALFRGGHVRGMNGHIARRQTTNYLDDAQREARRVTGGGDGLLHDAHGLADSTGARPGQIGAGLNRKIFTMDRNGGMFMEDARRATLAASSPTHYNYFHHSSFLGGQDVAAAGDMIVKDGWVKNISNNSGHYKPGQEQLLNSLDELEDMGVNTDASKVDLHNEHGRSTYSAGEFRTSRGDTGLLDARRAMRGQLEAFDRASLRHHEPE